MGEEKLSAKAGIDTTDFKTGISTMNAELRRINSAFLASAAALGDWAQDASGLEMKIGSLNDSIEVQQRKVAALKAEYERVKNESGENSSEARKLQDELNAQTIRLGKLNTELSKHSTALADAKTKNQGFDDSMEGMNRELSLNESGFRASAAALGNWAKDAGGLDMRIKALTAAMEIQRKKVDAVRVEHARVKSEFGESSKAAFNLQTQLNKEVETLGRMQNELKESSTALDKLEDESNQAGNAMDDLAKSSDKAGKESKNLGNALGGVKTVLAGVVGGVAALVGAVAGITGAVAGLAASTIGPARDLNETISKVKVVFGENADAVLKFGETSAASLGMSKNAALSAAGTYGNLFRSMGFTTSESSDLSLNLVKLAGDLASFNNISTDDALEKLRAGLVGETEPLKALGINMNEAALKAKALSLGLIPATDDTLAIARAALNAEKAQAAYNDAVKKYGDGSLQARDASLKLQEATQKADEAGQASVTTLTAQQKAQAAYAIIMEQSALAQGDFARTSDGLANQQRIFAAQIENTKATIGNAFLPVVTDAAVALNKFLNSEAVQGWVSALVDGIGQVSEIVKPLIDLIGNFDGDFSKLATVAGDVIKQLVTSLTAQAAQMISAGLEIILVLAEAMVAAIPALIPVVVDLLLSLVDFFVTNLPLLVTAGIDMILGLAKGLTDALPTLMPAMAQAIATIVESLVESLPLLIDAALQLVLALAEGLVNALPVLLEALPKIMKGLIEGMKKIAPMFGEASGQLIATLGMGLIQNIPLLLKTAFELIVLLVEGMISYFGETIPAAGDAFVQGLLGGIAEKWDLSVRDLTAMLNELWQTISNIFSVGMSFLQEQTAANFGMITNLWGDGFGQIKTVFKGAIDNLKLVFKAFSQAMAGDWYGFGQSLGKIWKNTWDTVATVLLNGWKNIQRIVGELVSWIINFFTKTDWAKIGRNIISGIENGLRNAAQWVYDTISNIVSDVIGFFNIDWEKVGNDIISGLVAGLNSAAGWLYDAISSIVNNLVEIILGIINGAGGDAGGAFAGLGRAAYALGGSEGQASGGTVSSESYTFYAPVVIGGQAGQRLGASIKSKRF
jgi:hypothetical protein